MIARLSDANIVSISRRCVYDESVSLMFLMRRFQS